MTQSLFINEDNLIRWDRADLASSGAFVNSGTGTWELLDADGLSLATGSMAYVASSRGRWHGTIDKADTDSLIEGATYFVGITLANGSGADGFRRVECVAAYNS